MKTCHCPKNQKGEEVVQETQMTAQAMRPVEVATKPSPLNGVGGGKFTTAFLVSFIVLLFGLTSWVAYNKFAGDERNEFRNHPPVVVRPVKPSQPDYITKQQAERMMGEVQERIDDIEDRMIIWNHRVWLLAIALNENANIRQDIDMRYHPCYPHPGYITFDGEWKIKRFPKTMHMTDEQRRSLENDIRR